MLNLSKSFFTVVLLIVIHFYFYGSSYVKELDYKLYDLTTMILSDFQEEKSDAYSVIVDIDEKSIQEFGQWPWSRIIDAELIDGISQMSPSAIGVNILFPEEDRLSPISMQSFYQKYFNTKIDLDALAPELQDNDKLLSKVLINSNATLPIYLQNKFYSAEHCQEMRYKQNLFVDIESNFLAKELLCNHPSLQDEIENFGFINADSDSDGVFRRVALFMKYKEEVFPSFALATLLSFYDALEFNKKEDTVLVNFSNNRPKILSAADVLRGRISMHEIQAKVVILGSSVVGLNSNHRIANGEHISNSMIHAMLVDNMLNDTLLVQPTYYKKLNMTFSFLLSVLMFMLLSRKSYVQISMIILALGSISLVSLFIMYGRGIYISMGYLWVPFISFFIVLLIYHLRVVNKAQQEQEKLFIRQSKLASMGEMISLIAHQWRQPLSAINGTVLNMDIDYRKERLDSKKFNNYLDDIERTTAHLSQTINDFTDFFSKNKEPHLFNLSSVITQVKNLAASSLACEVEIIYENAKEIEIKGYASELVQSLLVLLNNAVYVCQKNLPKVDKGKIFVHVAQSGENILISVEDNGGGVAKKDMKKIFNPYFTTKEKHNGTGLGLYILKLIVEDSMNGKVSVHNTQEGAVFTIKIPMNME
ncbi:MAG TPA: CHASE2 domain-containing protein [Campylobacterales bacterium]|nr:CHASE2 domain-containing protein [Campylobacterales bacterium]